MNRRMLIIALAAGLAAFPSACSTAGGQAGGSFTEADSGKNFTTSPGAALNIRLKGNYTTGYSWNIVSCDKSIIQPAGSQYIPSQPQRVGSGGVQHYTFNIVGKGQTTLKITYHRVWEKDVPPAQVFDLHIVSK
ncbi:MAG: protease inhibitor I42 family protein [Verrucomicrobia bacterium]|nr:protease inhibitor I42 family protein [Verrucomicrobiota bacterium]